MSKELVKNQIELILKQMMSKRKPDKVGFVPYSEPIGYNPCWPGFDFAKIYPEWEEGDAGYVVANLPGPCERDLVISVTGDCTFPLMVKSPRAIRVNLWQSLLKCTELIRTVLSSVRETISLLSVRRREVTTLNLKYILVMKVVLLCGRQSIFTKPVP